MQLDRSNALGTSTLAHFSCQLARHFLDLRNLGLPSLGRLADEVALQLTADERGRIQADAATDYYCWGIAPGAEPGTLLAARTIGWLEFWASLPWGRDRVGNLDLEQVVQAIAAGGELDTTAWIDPAARDLLVDCAKAARTQEMLERVAAAEVEKTLSAAAAAFVKHHGLEPAIANALVDVARAAAAQMKG